MAYSFLFLWLPQEIMGTITFSDEGRRSIMIISFKECAKKVCIWLAAYLMCQVKMVYDLFALLEHKPKLDSVEVTDDWGSASQSQYLVNHQRGARRH